MAGRRSTTAKKGSAPLVCIESLYEQGQGRHPGIKSGSFRVLSSRFRLLSCLLSRIAGPFLANSYVDLTLFS